MKVLIVGSGAREHALAWRLRQSPGLTALWVASGNGGTAQIATNLNVSPGDVEAIPKYAKGLGIDLVVVGRRTLRCIRQNLFLAFVYNVVAIPAAAFALLGTHGPALAAAAMALSDLSVIGNAARLRWSLARERRRRPAIACTAGTPAA